VIRDAVRGAGVDSLALTPMLASGTNLGPFTPDGKWYVCNYRLTLSDLYLVTGLK
jgi:hypothetical protein